MTDQSTAQPKLSMLANVAAFALVAGTIFGVTVQFIDVAADRAPASTPATIDDDGAVIVNEDGEPIDVADSPSESTPTPLPPCPTEDSEGCYWDADTMGNGEGDDIVTQPTPEPTIGEAQPAEEHPVDTDYTLETWPFTTGETLVCGQGAKPAIDYRGDEIGWWAYCEPALVD